MPLWLDTSGRTHISVAICGRCCLKKAYDDLVQDPNDRLWVCPECCDILDPYRRAPRRADDISLEHPRPDTPLTPVGPIPVYANQIDGIAEYSLPTPWRALKEYAEGDTIWPKDWDLDTTTLPQPWFLCAQAGTSGAAAPNWVANGVTDGTVRWLNLGIWV